MFSADCPNAYSIPCTYLDRSEDSGHLQEQMDVRIRPISAIDFWHSQNLTLTKALLSNQAGHSRPN